MQRKIMIISHTFLSFGDHRVRWHAETNYGHSTPFRHPETIEFDGTQRQIMVILSLFSSRVGEPDDMRRQIMVIPHTFSPFRYSRVRWHAETNFVFCAFCHPEAAGPMTCGDKLWSFRTAFCHPEVIVSDGTQRQIMVIPHSFSPSRGDGVRWHAETNYGHFAQLFAIQR